MRSVFDSHLAVCAAAVLAGCADHRGDRELIPPADAVSVVFETQLEVEGSDANKSDAELADFDGDGRSDLAILDLEGGITILFGSGGGGLTAASTVQVAEDASEVRAADLDGDGDPDLVVASYRARLIDILLNDGSGGFTRLTPSIQTGLIPTAMVIFDCDGDTIPDIILTHLARESLELFTGNGDGTFQRSAIPIPGPSGGQSRTAGVTVTDLDGDGVLEALIVDSDQDRILVVPATPAAGGPHVPQVVSFPVGSGPFGIASGDVDGDGALDIVISFYGDSSIAVMSTDFTVVKRFDAGNVPGFIAVGKLDGDDIDDIAVSMIGSQTVAVFTGTRDPSADHGAVTRLPTTGSPLRPLTGDVNGDMRTDLVIAGIGTRVVNVFFGVDYGFAGGRLYDSSLGYPAMVTAADFDGDGTPEVAVGGLGEEKVAIMRSIGAASPGGPPRLEETRTLSLADASATRSVHRIAAADVDGDGRPDIVVAVDGGVKVCRNQGPDGLGGTSFEVLPSDGVIAGGDRPRILAVDDLSDDGIVDVAVAYLGEDKVGIAIGIGNGAFAPALGIEVPGGASGIAIGDFDGDGRPELAVSSRQVALLNVFEWSEAGAPRRSAEVPLTELPTGLTVTDIDLDGRADLVVHNGSVDSVTLLSGGSSRGFPAKLTVPTGRAPNAIVSSDLNGDLRPDLVVATLAGSEFRTILGNGAGGLAASLRFPGLFATSSIALADLDGDGFDDLIVGSFLQRRVGVFRNVSFVLPAP